MSKTTSLLDEEIAVLEQEIRQLETELADLDKGVYHMRLDNGMTLQVRVTGDELRFDEEAIISALGLNRNNSAASGASSGPISTSKGKLPYILIGAGVLILFVVILVIVRVVSDSRRSQAQAAVPALSPTATATVTPTITPTPTVTPTPTPPLIPDGFVGRVPALLRIQSLGGEWSVSKGEWQTNSGQVVLAEEGGKVRYYDSFVGVSNLIIGGDGSLSESPLYLMRSADINDVITVVDRANRTFFFRLLPFGNNRVERYISPDDISVIAPTERPSLTIIIRTGEEERMVLRGELFETTINQE